MSEDSKLQAFTPDEWHEQMFIEVKVAYRLVEVCGPPDIDAQPHDAEFVARTDAEYEHWLNRVRAEVWDEGYTVGNAHNGRRDANPYREAVQSE